jgi:hypothetical protein
VLPYSTVIRRPLWGAKLLVEHRRNALPARGFESCLICLFIFWKVRNHLACKTKIKHFIIFSPFLQPCFLRKWLCFRRLWELVCFSPSKSLHYWCLVPLDLLGERLECEDEGRYRDNANLCYICSGNVDKFVECWFVTTPLVSFLTLSPSPFFSFSCF